LPDPKDLILRNEATKFLLFYHLLFLALSIVILAVDCTAIETGRKQMRTHLFEARLRFGRDDLRQGQTGIFCGIFVAGRRKTRHEQATKTTKGTADRSAGGHRDIWPNECGGIECPPRMWCQSRVRNKVRLADRLHEVRADPRRQGTSIIHRQSNVKWLAHRVTVTFCRNQICRLRCKFCNGRFEREQARPPMRTSLGRAIKAQPVDAFSTATRSTNWRHNKII
jgi:hypothetical protein